MANAGKKPSLPLPEPLRGEEKDSFAYHTVSTRLPNLARLVLEENEFPPDIAASLVALIAELPYGVIRPLLDLQAPEALDWESFLIPTLGQTWLQVPWFFAEAYFFRRILEATSFFTPGGWTGIDPYLYEKRRGLETSQVEIEALAALGDDLGQAGWNPDGFSHLLAADLWGNQADLSLWPVDGGRRPSHASAQEARAHLLLDDTASAIKVLSSFQGANRVGGRLLGTGVPRVDFLVDNAGFELVGDLCLADYLLRVRAAAEIHLHLKAHPTYISDATLTNVLETLTFLQAASSASVRGISIRLMNAYAQGRLRLRPDFFWCSPLAAWEMPDRLLDDFAHASLVISKGDANYRRLVGDRHWPATVPFGQVVSYFPAPLLALRTFKSEVATGLRPGQAEAVAQEDPNWMTNGRWGIIQFEKATCPIE
jgi:uncharacterized protein with ATP-grasp and redox domains